MEAIFWITAIFAVVFIPFYCSYWIRRAKQRQFNRKWNLPQDSGGANSVDNAEILGRTGFIDDLTDTHQIS